MKHYDLLKLVLDESRYSAMLKNKKDLENENRLENLKELLRAMNDYDNLQGFLEHVALATSIGFLRGRTYTPVVNFKVVVEAAMAAILTH